VEENVSARGRPGSNDSLRARHPRARLLCLVSDNTDPTPDPGAVIANGDQYQDHHHSESDDAHTQKTEGKMGGQRGRQMLDPSGVGPTPQHEHDYHHNYQYHPKHIDNNNNDYKTNSQNASNHYIHNHHNYHHNHYDHHWRERKRCTQLPHTDCIKGSDGNDNT
jgi:hypothetical protein